VTHSLNEGIDCGTRPGEYAVEKKAGAIFHRMRASDKYRPIPAPALTRPRLIFYN
jgi:hypothetical protein